MKPLDIPLLNKDQIEVRVGQVSAKGCTLLLYKTSRTDAEILDRVVGAGNWQKRFYTLQGVGIGEQVRSIVVCSVGIYDEDKHEWVWKDDSGTESQVEQDKGVCSDAFKRAAGGSCWGIGRELYYAGFIFAKVPTKERTNGKGYDLADKFMSFEIKEIKWNENPLSLKTLVIVDNNGNVVYSKGSNEKVSQNADLTPKTTTIEEPKPFTKEDEQLISKFQGFNTQPNTIDLHDRTVIESYLNTCEKESQDKFYDYIAKHYGTMVVSKLSELQGKELVSALKNRKQNERKTKKNFRMVYETPNSC